MPTPSVTLTAAALALAAGHLTTHLAAGDVASGSSPSPSPVAVIRDGDTVWLADSDSNVLHTVTVDPESVIAHPQPGVVVFIGGEHIERLDVSTGELATIPHAAPAVAPPVDGQLIAVASVPPPDPCQFPSSLRAPRCEPPAGPDTLVGLLDVVTGASVDVDALFTDPVIVAETARVLLVADTDHDGIVAIGLDRRFDGITVLPTDDAGDVVLGDGGSRIAVRAGGDVLVGAVGEEFDVVASGVSRLVGAVPGGVVTSDGSRLAVAADDGTVIDLHLASGSARLIGDTGLLRVDRDGAATVWYRVAGSGAVELDRVRGMHLLAATDGAWWFADREHPAPFSGSPVVAVDPTTGATVDIAGTLEQLAAITGQAASSPSGRIRFATFPEPRGFDGLAIADAQTGTVRSIDLEPPLAFAHDDVHILSMTVSGPTITTLDPQGPTLIAPIFAIDLAHDASAEYRWVTG